MDLYAIGIPVTFLILAAIASWLAIMGKGPWWTKFIFVTVVLYFSLGLWTSLGSLSGWAANTPMPSKFVLHWSLVVEPSKINSKEPGAIFFWATEINEDNQPKKEEVNYFLQPFVSKKMNVEPRVYRLPYSEKLHQDLIDVMKKIKQGKTVVGEGKKIAAQEGDGDGGNGKGKGKGKGKGMGEGREGMGKNSRGRNGGSLSQEQEFMFYDLPPFMMPPKDPE